MITLSEVDPCADVARVSALLATNKEQSSGLVIDKELPTAQKAWWVEMRLDAPLAEQERVLLGEFFWLNEDERPVAIYMRRDGVREAFGEWLLAKGLPICFVKDRESIGLVA